MNWEIVASTGEWVGAFAVVGTLFYLAKQIQQQNKVAEYSAWKSAMSDFSDFNRMFVDDVSKAELFIKGLENPDSLTDQEAVLFQMIFRLEYNGMLNLWKAHQTGNLPDDDWIGIASWFASELNMPGGVVWRKEN